MSVGVSLVVKCVPWRDLTACSSPSSCLADGSDQRHHQNHQRNRNLHGDLLRDIKGGFATRNENIQHQKPPQEENENVKKEDPVPSVVGRKSGPESTPLTSYKEGETTSCCTHSSSPPRAPLSRCHCSSLRHNEVDHTDPSYFFYTEGMLRIPTCIRAPLLPRTSDTGNVSSSTSSRNHHRHRHYYTPNDDDDFLHQQGNATDSYFTSGPLSCPPPPSLSSSSPLFFPNKEEERQAKTTEEEEEGEKQSFFTERSSSTRMLFLVGRHHELSHVTLHYRLEKVVTMKKMKTERADDQKEEIEHKEKVGNQEGEKGDNANDEGKYRLADCRNNSERKDTRVNSHYPPPPRPPHHCDTNRTRVGRDLHHHGGRPDSCNSAAHDLISPCLFLSLPASELCLPVLWATSTTTTSIASHSYSISSPEERIKSSSGRKKRRRRTLMCCMMVNPTSATTHGCFSSSRAKIKKTAKSIFKKNEEGRRRDEKNQKCVFLVKHTRDKWRRRYCEAALATLFQSTTFISSATSASFLRSLPLKSTPLPPQEEDEEEHQHNFHCPRSYRRGGNMSMLPPFTSEPHGKKVEEDKNMMSRNIFLMSREELEKEKHGKGLCMPKEEKKKFLFGDRTRNDSQHESTLEEGKEEKGGSEEDDGFVLVFGEEETASGGRKVGEISPNSAPSTIDPIPSLGMTSSSSFSSFPPPPLPPPPPHGRRFLFSPIMGGGNNTCHPTHHNNSTNSPTTRTPTSTTNPISIPAPPFSPTPSFSSSSDLSPPPSSPTTNSSGKRKINLKHLFTSSAKRKNSTAAAEEKEKKEKEEDAAKNLSEFDNGENEKKKNTERDGKVEDEKKKCKEEAQEEGKRKEGRTDDALQQNINHPPPPPPTASPPVPFPHAPTTTSPVLLSIHLALQKLREEVSMMLTEGGVHTSFPPSSSLPPFPSSSCTAAAVAAAPPSPSKKSQRNASPMNTGETIPDEEEEEEEEDGGRGTEKEKKNVTLEKEYVSAIFNNTSLEDWEFCIETIEISFIRHKDRRETFSSSRWCQTERGCGGGDYWKREKQKREKCASSRFSPFLSRAWIRLPQLACLLSGDSLGKGVAMNPSSLALPPLVIREEEEEKEEELPFSGEDQIFQDDVSPFPLPLPPPVSPPPPLLSVSFSSSTSSLAGKMCIPPPPPSSSMRTSANGPKISRKMEKEEEGCRGGGEVAADSFSTFGGNAEDVEDVFDSHAMLAPLCFFGHREDRDANHMSCKTSHHGKEKKDWEVPLSSSSCVPSFLSCSCSSPSAVTSRPPPTFFFVCWAANRVVEMLDTGMRRRLTTTATMTVRLPADKQNSVLTSCPPSAVKEEDEEINNNASPPPLHYCSRSPPCPSPLHLSSSISTLPNCSAPILHLHVCSPLPVRLEQLHFLAFVSLIPFSSPPLTLPLRQSSSGSHHHHANHHVDFPQISTPFPLAPMAPPPPPSLPPFFLRKKLLQHSSFSWLLFSSSPSSFVTISPSRTTCCHATSSLSSLPLPPPSPRFLDDFNDFPFLSSSSSRSISASFPPFSSSFLWISTLSSPVEEGEGKSTRLYIPFDMVKTSANPSPFDEKKTEEDDEGHRHGSAGSAVIQNEENAKAKDEKRVNGKTVREKRGRKDDEMEQLERGWVEKEEVGVPVVVKQKPKMHSLYDHHYHQLLSSSPPPLTGTEVQMKVGPFYYFVSGVVFDVNQLIGIFDPLLRQLWKIIHSCFSSPFHPPSSSPSTFSSANDHEKEEEEESLLVMILPHVPTTVTPTARSTLEKMFFTGAGGGPRKDEEARNPPHRTRQEGKGGKTGGCFPYWNSPSFCLENEESEEVSLSSIPHDHRTPPPTHNNVHPHQKKRKKKKVHACRAEFGIFVSADGYFAIAEEVIIPLLTSFSEICCSCSGDGDGGSPLPSCSSSTPFLLSPAATRSMARLCSTLFYYRLCQSYSEAASSSVDENNNNKEGEEEEVESEEKRWMETKWYFAVLADFLAVTWLQQPHRFYCSAGGTSSCPSPPPLPPRSSCSSSSSLSSILLCCPWREWQADVRGFLSEERVQLEMISAVWNPSRRASSSSSLAFSAMLSSSFMKSAEEFITQNSPPTKVVTTTGIPATTTPALLLPSSSSPDKLCVMEWQLGVRALLFLFLSHPGIHSLGEFFIKEMRKKENNQNKTVESRAITAGAAEEDNGRYSAREGEKDKQEHLPGCKKEDRVEVGGGGERFFCLKQLLNTSFPLSSQDYDDVEDKEEHSSGCCCGGKSDGCPLNAFPPSPAATNMCWRWGFQRLQHLFTSPPSPPSLSATGHHSPNEKHYSNHHHHHHNDDDDTSTTRSSCRKMISDQHAMRDTRTLWFNQCRHIYDSLFSSCAAAGGRDGGAWPRGCWGDCARAPPSRPRRQRQQPTIIMKKEEEDGRGGRGMFSEGKLNPVHHVLLEEETLGMHNNHTCIMSGAPWRPYSLLPSSLLPPPSSALLFLPSRRRSSFFLSSSSLTICILLTSPSSSSSSIFRSSSRQRAYSGVTRCGRENARRGNSDHRNHHETVITTSRDTQRTPFFQLHLNLKVKRKFPSSISTSSSLSSSSMFRPVSCGAPFSSIFHIVWWRWQVGWSRSQRQHFLTSWFEGVFFPIFTSLLAEEENDYQNDPHEAGYNPSPHSLQNNNNTCGSDGKWGKRERSPPAEEDAREENENEEEEGGEGVTPAPSSFSFSPSSSNAFLYSSMMNCATFLPIIQIGMDQHRVLSTNQMSWSFQQQKHEKEDKEEGAEEKEEEEESDRRKRGDKRIVVPYKNTTTTTTTMNREGVEDLSIGYNNENKNSCRNTFLTSRKMNKSLKKINSNGKGNDCEEEDGKEEMMIHQVFSYKGSLLLANANYLPSSGVKEDRGGGESTRATKMTTMGKERPSTSFRFSSSSSSLRSTSTPLPFSSSSSFPLHLLRSRRHPTRPLPVSSREECMKDSSEHFLYFFQEKNLFHAMEDDDEKEEEEDNDYENNNADGKEEENVHDFQSERGRGRRGRGRGEGRAGGILRHHRFDSFHTRMQRNTAGKAKRRAQRRTRRGQDENERRRREAVHMILHCLVGAVDKVAEEEGQEDEGERRNEHEEKQGKRAKKWRRIIRGEAKDWALRMNDDNTKNHNNADAPLTVFSSDWHRYHTSPLSSSKGESSSFPSSSIPKRIGRGGYNNTKDAKGREWTGPPLQQGVAPEGSTFSSSSSSSSSAPFVRHWRRTTTRTGKRGNRMEEHDRQAKRLLLDPIAHAFLTLDNDHPRDDGHGVPLLPYGKEKEEGKNEGGDCPPHHTAAAAEGGRGEKDSRGGGEGKLERSSSTSASFCSSSSDSSPPSTVCFQLPIFWFSPSLSGGDILARTSIPLRADEERKRRKKKEQDEAEEDDGEKWKKSHYHRLQYPASFFHHPPSPLHDDHHHDHHLEYSPSSSPPPEEVEEDLDTLSFTVNADRPSFELFQRGIIEVVDYIFMKDLQDELETFLLFRTNTYSSSSLSSSSSSFTTSKQKKILHTAHRWIRSLLCQYVMWRWLQCVSVHLLMGWHAPLRPNTREENGRGDEEEGRRMWRQRCRNCGGDAVGDANNDYPAHPPPHAHYHHIHKNSFQKTFTSPPPSCCSACLALALYEGLLRLKNNLQEDVRCLNATGGVGVWSDGEDKVEKGTERKEQRVQECITFVSPPSSSPQQTSLWNASPTPSSWHVPLSSTAHWNWLWLLLRDSAHKSAMGLEPSLLSLYSFSPPPLSYSGSGGDGNRSKDDPWCASRSGYRDWFNGIWREILRAGAVRGGGGGSPFSSRPHSLFPPFHHTETGDELLSAAFPPFLENLCYRGRRRRRMKQMLTVPPPSFSSPSCYSSSYLFPFSTSLPHFIKYFFSSAHLKHCQREGWNRLAQLHRSYNQVVYYVHIAKGGRGREGGPSSGSPLLLFSPPPVRPTMLITATVRTRERGRGGGVDGDIEEEEDKRKMVENKKADLYSYYEDENDDVTAVSRDGNDCNTSGGYVQQSELFSSFSSFSEMERNETLPGFWRQVLYADTRILLKNTMRRRET